MVLINLIPVINVQESNHNNINANDSIIIMCYKACYHHHCGCNIVITVLTLLSVSHIKIIIIIITLQFIYSHCIIVINIIFIFCSYYLNGYWGKKTCSNNNKNMKRTAICDDVSKANEVYEAEGGAGSKDADTRTSTLDRARDAGQRPNISMEFLFIYQNWSVFRDLSPTSFTAHQYFKGRERERFFFRKILMFMSVRDDSCEKK